MWGVLEGVLEGEEVAGRMEVKEPLPLPPPNILSPSPPLPAGRIVRCTCASSTMSRAGLDCNHWRETTVNEAVIVEAKKPRGFSSSVTGPWW